MGFIFDYLVKMCCGAQQSAVLGMGDGVALSVLQLLKVKEDEARSIFLRFHSSPPCFFPMVFHIDKCSRYETSQQ